MKNQLQDLEIMNNIYKENNQNQSINFNNKYLVTKSMKRKQIIIIYYHLQCLLLKEKKKEDKDFG